ncbi:hypothetical protein ACIA5C_32700 [Actinoplanes sp. NPDC051343]|uniref:hypothetical protein n=1 Tax=Actinoplanes sp. NPDC051343 TaxID=3363906 RepID=UPI00379556D9
MRALRREWTRLHPLLRRAVTVMVGAGTTLLVLGVVGDATGVWSHVPFLTNVASSLTGALFGLPVALVVVQRLLDTQTAANDRAEASRLLVRSVQHMRVAALTLAGPASDDDLPLLVARCDVAVAEAQEWAGPAFAAKVRPRRLRASMYQRAYLRQVLTVHEAARQALKAYASTGLGAPAPALERIRSEAAFLQDHVQPAVVRLGGRWPAEAYTRTLRHVSLLSDAASPVATIERLLDAFPATQLAALLPEPDAARAGLDHPDLPLPLPRPKQLEELRSGLGGLVTHLTQARQIAEAVDDLQDAVDLGREAHATRA